jgi:hypothetical protein
MLSDTAVTLQLGSELRALCRLFLWYDIELGHAPKAGFQWLKRVSFQIASESELKYRVFFTKQNPVYLKLNRF